MFLDFKMSKCSARRDNLIFKIKRIYEIQQKASR